MIDAKLLELLVCPLTKGKIELDRENSRFVSTQAGLAFPIVKGVPDMRLDTAITIEEAQER